MSEAAAPAHASRRPHIQGIRAVAVILVIAGHAFAWPPGGFLGVDVFFVVSGFVITLSLLREAERDGTVSLRSFIIRRVGRLFPAGALVVAVTVAAGFVVFFLPRAIELAMDGAASVLSVANWRTARLGTDYFAGSATSSPLQHYWSLSVEEQFYVLWPFVFALCTLAGWPRMRRWAGWIAGAATALSFAIAMVESAQRPAWAYFSFESRAWELGVGVILAIVLVRRQLHPLFSRVLTVVGALGIGIGVMTVDGSTGFPAPWALPVVLGTAALITSGETATPSPLLAPLRTKPLVFVGDISYSLYLWHYPLLIFGVALAPGWGTWASLVLLVPAAYLTYRYVEVPCRDRAGSIAARGKPGRHLAWGASAIVVVAALSATQAFGPAAVVDTPQLTAVASPGTPFASNQQLERKVAAALDGPEAPPSALNTLWPSASAAQFAATRGCLRPPDAVAEASASLQALCVFPADADAPTLVVFGDSVAVSWLPGIVAAADGRWRIVAIGIQSCPPYTVTVTDRTGRGSFAGECDRARAEALDLIEELDPELVVLSSASGSFDRLVDAVGTSAATTQWRDGARTTLEDIAARTTARTVILPSPPEAVPVLACATRITGTGACGHSPSAAWELKTDAETAAAGAAARAAVVDTLAWFCLDDQCPAVVDGTVVLADAGHLTTDYATRLGAVLDETLDLSAVASE